MSESEGPAPPAFEPIDHTADLAYIARGATREELFRHAAQGLTAFLLDLDSITPSLLDTIEVSGADLEECLVSWLNELIFREEVMGRVYREFDVEFTGPHVLRVRCGGEPLDRARHALLTDIKAATYHDLRIRSVASTGQWRYEARIVLDI
ncbi:MAG: archease [Candidatus Eisenbacteria bacterium]